MRAKPNYLLPLLLMISVLFSCEETGTTEEEFLFVILGKGDQISETIRQDWHLDANTGDVFLLGVTDGNDTWAWLDNYEWSVSDPSVVTVSGGMLSIIQGGESTVTLSAEGYQTSFTVSAPKTDHGKIYLTCDANTHNDESGSFYPSYRYKLIVDGAVTEETAHFVTADGEGNLWQGAYDDGHISLKRNGQNVGEGLDYTIPYKEMSFREAVLAKAVKRGLALILTHYSGNNMSNSYCIVAPDGSAIEGPAGGYITAIDEDAGGNVTLWGIWWGNGTVHRVSQDGTVITEDAPGDGHSIINAGGDGHGNEYVMCSDAEGGVVIFKNGDILYQIKNADSPKMCISGSDVWVAYSTAEDLGHSSLYLFKNGESLLLKSGLFGSVNMDFCFSSGGTPYVACHDGLYGFHIFKDMYPVLFIPCSLGTSPTLAVVD